MAIDESSSPIVYVIAGPNGAGKTTFANEFLPNFVDCPEFLNADLIAAGLSPFAPERQNVRAGRILLTRMRELTARREDFGFETTLSGRGYVRRLSRMRRDGYRVTLFFLWLPDVEMAVKRVANRVQQGGHPVPEPDIRRRFAAGLRNFCELYQPLVDVWWLYDASRLPFRLIAWEREGTIQRVQSDLYDQVVRTRDG